MATKKKGLGRGYDSLFIDNSSEALNENSTVTLPIGEVEPDRSQPRKVFDEAALQELEDSVREYGILQPLLVRPKADGSYIIVAGERRWRAARRAGLSFVPVIIKPLTDAEAAAIALIENLQREDLNAIEEAQGIRRLMDEYGFTQEEAAERISKSRPAVANALRLLALPEDVIQLVSDAKLSAGHARTLLGLDNKALISELAKKIISEKLSVRQTEQLVKAFNKQPSKPKVKKKRDIFYDETELALSDVLKRKVNVVISGAGGKIEIEFFDADDLKKLVSVFNDE